MHYRLFDHTADLGVEVFGKTRKDLFVNAAAALFDLLLDAAGHPTHRRQGNRDRGVRHHGSFCKLSS